MSNCVSKYALNTYGLHRKRGRMHFLISARSLFVVMNLCPSLAQRNLGYFENGAIIGESGRIVSPETILSLRYASKAFAPRSVRKVKYSCFVFERDFLTLTIAGLFSNVATSLTTRSGRSLTISPSEAL